MWWMLLACGLLDNDSTVTVVNDDPRSLGPVFVELEGQRVFHGMLTPGERRTVTIHPTRDASFRVYGHSAAGSFDVSDLGYSTPNDGQDHVFHLKDNTVRYGDATAHPNRVQLLLDAPALRTFLHPEVAANLPLTVALPATLAEEGRQSTFERQPVVVTRSARLIVEEHGAGYQLRIPDEGVVGTASFSHGNAGWSLDHLQLAEQ